MAAVSPMNLRLMPRILEFARALPPHPGPLPMGEGESLSGLSASRGACFFRETGCRDSLSPKGEGWGERGNMIFVIPCADLLVHRFKARNFSSENSLPSTGGGIEGEGWSVQMRSI